MTDKLPLLEYLRRVYPDRRDRYGYTVLSRSRAIRGIKCNDESVRHLIESDLLDILVSAQAILPLRLVRGRQDDYIFLVQKRIRPAVVPSEWSSTMFADAALLVLRAEMALCSSGLTVDDPHPWNILFDTGTPYIVDMGAFNVTGTGLHWSAKLDADIWPAANVFNALFLNVVTLVAAERGHYVRRLLTDWNPVSGSDTAALLLKTPALFFSFVYVRLRSFFFRWAWLALRSVGSASQKTRLKHTYLRMLEKYLERMRLRIGRNLHIVSPCTGLSVGATTAIASLLGQYPSRQTVVYGADRQTVDIICAAEVGLLLVVSPDEALIEQLYRDVRVRIACAVMDLRSPTPGAGPGNRWITPAMERFRSEVGLFFFDLNELVIEKCLMVSELIKAVDSLCAVAALIIFKKLPLDNAIAGRDYGQASDEVLLSCLDQVFEVFEVIYNDKHEIAVRFNRNNNAQFADAVRK